MDKIKSPVYSNPDSSNNSSPQGVPPSIKTQPNPQLITPQYQNNQGRVFKYFGIFALVAFFIFLVYFLLTGPFAQMTKATVSAVPSQTESMMFAHPLTIKADGVDKSKIDVFIASDEGKPLTNQNIEIITTLGTIVPTKATTDSSGHVVFELTIDTPGIAVVSFTIDSQPFDKNISVKAE